MAQVRVQTWKLGKLKPQPRNPLTHSEEQVKQIAKSIERFGFLNPILVDEKGFILAGHGRYAAAQYLKLKTVPVIVKAGLSKLEKQAYILADNRIARNATWNQEFTGEALKALQDDSALLELTSFTDAELEAHGLKAAFSEHGVDAELDEDFKQSHITYQIVFDDHGQQETFFAFVRYLKEKYGKPESVGGKLAVLVEENGFKS